MAEIKRIETYEIEELSRIASAVVKEHFDPLIGAAQNDYMISKFQSVEAISEQFAHGYRYYWVLKNGDKAGFFAFYPKEDKMYLSKFYVLKAYRGHHLAKEMFAYIVAETHKEGLSAIFLNVNRGNSDVIAIYKHLGFRIIREEKNDIGQGFYMDDYVMKCNFEQ